MGVWLYAEKYTHNQRRYSEDKKDKDIGGFPAFPAYLIHVISTRTDSSANDGFAVFYKSMPNVSSYNNIQC